MGNPFKENKINMRLDFVPFTANGRLTINSGKDSSDVWGLSMGKTYVEKSGDRKFKKFGKGGFWVPTYQYFIELPVRIREANAISYEGDSIIMGDTCQLVIASWNTLKPQKKIDQYRIWIIKRSGLLKMVDYTIRDQYKFLWGRTIIKSWKSFAGVLLPAEMEVHSNLNEKKIMHVMRVHSFVPDSVKKESIQIIP